MRTTPQYLPRKIEGFPDYTIYQDGTITSNNGLIRPIQQNNGYHHVTLYRDKKPYQFSVHRLVAENFITKRNADQDQVNHINGKKNDNRVANLEWVSHQENTRHAMDMGLRLIGEKHSMAKLNERQVNEIRKLAIGGMKLTEIAKRFNISPTNTGDIVNWKIWKHLKRVS